MEERGFIRDMLDVKVLILFVAAKAKYPLTLQKIYELCYQDDRLSYFDVGIAVPQMVERLATLVSSAVSRFTV